MRWKPSDGGTRRFLLTAICSLLGAVGCAASPKAYLGPELDRAQLAMIVGATKEETLGNQYVEITDIDGATEVADWSAPATAAHLLPGRHRLGVQCNYYASPTTVVMLGAAVALAADVASAPGNADTERTLLVDLEPGYGYGIHVTRDPFQYYVSRFPNVWPLRADWTVPGGATPCTPSEDGNGVLECYFPPRDSQH